MFQPSLDPTIDMMARASGCTYLEAAWDASALLGRPLSLTAALAFVDNFARNGGHALFTYEPITDVMLFTLPSPETTVSFVTDASMEAFYVQVVWQSRDGSDCWCTTLMPDAAVARLLSLLKRRWIAARLAEAVADLRRLGHLDLAAKAKRARAIVRGLRPPHPYHAKS